MAPRRVPALFPIARYPKAGRWKATQRAALGLEARRDMTETWVDA